MAVAANALTNAVKFSIYLDEATATNQARKEALIDAASAAIEIYCDRKFFHNGSTFGVYDERYNGNDRERLTLNQYPIIDAANNLTVTIGDPTDTSPTSLTRNDDYFEIVDSGTLINKGLWGAGFQNVRVQYQAGYATIPLDLEYACNMLVVDWYLNPTRVPLRSEAVEGVTASFYEGIMPPQVRNLLDATYRNRSIV